MVRKLVLMMSVSLDGLVARSGNSGAGGWGVPPEDPVLKTRKLDWLHDAGLHLMGRNTYQEMAGFWPYSDDQYAAPMNGTPKIVFSKTLTKADWAQSTIASGDLTKYRLVLQPVALGDGLPLFAGLTAPFVLDLVEARAYADGSVLHVYHPANGRAIPDEAGTGRPAGRLPGDQFGEVVLPGSGYSTVAGDDAAASSPAVKPRRQCATTLPVREPARPSPSVWWRIW